jgi:TPR repeat protein
LKSWENGFSEEYSILNTTRLSIKQATYLLLVGKMYLYGLLPSNYKPELRYYATHSNYMAAYYYLRTAAEKYENKEAYYMLGVLENFKLVPDKILETNL